MDPKGPSTFEADRVRTALRRAWSIETAIQWTAENPASGQCNVTAAVIHDLFGGDVLRTRLGDVWHYYNRLDGVRHDLTDSQFLAPRARFAAPEHYSDDVSSRDAAMVGIPNREYAALRTTLLHELDDRPPAIPG